jgi:hypothetical protein
MSVGITSLKNAQQGLILFIALAAHIEVVADERFKTGHILTALAGLGVLVDDGKDFIARDVRNVCDNQPVHDPGNQFI